MSNYKKKFHDDNEALLKRKLQRPERVEAERLFAEKHKNDSDEALIDYAARQKMKFQKGFKRQKLIGYCYYVERFGDWSRFAYLVNQRIKTIKEEPSLREEYLRNRNGRDDTLEYEEKLERTLREPERAAAERRFAEEHARDTDSQLRDYLIRAKLEDKNIRPLTFIGYRYIVYRFGSWEKAMRRVNQEIALKNRRA